MNIINVILENLFSFIAIISLIVFIHELGHFLVARFFGVKVEEFSIGMGKKLFGFRDKKRTLWKFCLLPVGGYVKMFGDRNGASLMDDKALSKMTKEEKKISFAGKNVYQRAAIVIAGPLANFILAILLFTTLFTMNGYNTILPVVDDVMPNSAAFESGLQKGDKILEVDGDKIVEFDDLRAIISISADKELLFKIERAGQILEQKITPKNQVRTDIFGDEVKLGTLGVVSSQIEHHDLNLGQAFIHANNETYKSSIAIFKAIGQLITGQRSIEELGGPIKIAKYSGKSVEMGITMVIWFCAVISLNLGVMNLLPIPVLDGGHLFFYIIEAIRGKPLSNKTQELCFRVGFSLILTLMLFTTFNDIKHLFLK